jgi:branched-chain amino acid transport system substrate-binding protein
MNISRRKLTLAASLAIAVSAIGFNPDVNAQTTKDVEVGLIAPMSGLYAKFGTLMRMGAEMGIKDINDQGGIKALGGATLKLVSIDSGDTTEKAKSAAQRMVADYKDIVVGTGAYLSSFTLAVTEVTERAKLPMLTLSYADQITDRGFKYVFQTSATAGKQAEIALPLIMNLAQEASGKRPKTVAIITDNTAASLSSVKALKGGLLEKNGLKLVFEQVFTPPLADASVLVQQVRQRRPDLVFFLPTVIADAKLILEKMNEMHLRVPVISYGIAIAEPEVLNTVDPKLLNGVMTAVANWGAKGQEGLIKRLKDEYHQPWMTQNTISTYGDMWIIKDALEHAGKADREAVAQALHTMDAGPAKYFPGGEIKFDETGRRVGASLTVVQWQNGVPVTVFPKEEAIAAPIWPSNK